MAEKQTQPFGGIWELGWREQCRHWPTMPFVKVPQVMRIAWLGSRWREVKKIWSKLTANWWRAPPPEGAPPSHSGPDSFLKSPPSPPLPRPENGRGSRQLTSTPGTAAWHGSVCCSLPASSLDFPVSSFPPRWRRLIQYPPSNHPGTLYLMSCHNCGKWDHKFTCWHPALHFRVFIDFRHRLRRVSQMQPASVSTAVNWGNTCPTASLSGHRIQLGGSCMIP